jgi:hypothetical protein
MAGHGIGDGTRDVRFRADRGDRHCCEGVEDCSQQHARELWSTIISPLILTALALLLVLESCNQGKSWDSACMEAEVIKTVNDGR